jgi:DNA-binding CsgD family transcriptional regulator
VRRAEFARLLTDSVRDQQPTFTQVKQLSPAFVDELVGEYRAGASVYDLQERHGVHRNTIAKHLKHRGVQLGKSPLSESEVAQAKELYGQRISLNTIGRMMGRDPKTVKRAVTNRS